MRVEDSREHTNAIADRTFTYPHSHIEPVCMPLRQRMVIESFISCQNDDQLKLISKTKELLVDYIHAWMFM